MSAVKTNLLFIEARSEKFWKINKAPIQPAERLPNNPERTVKRGGVNSFTNKDYSIYDYN